MSTHRDPTDRRNKWRWDLAHHLNKIPGTCWTHLVAWALGDRRLVDIGNNDDARQDSLCRRGAAENGTCYCGKITRDGAR
jgi:hypothetical protein